MNGSELAEFLNAMWLLSRSPLAPSSMPFLTGTIDWTIFGKDNACGVVVTAHCGPFELWLVAHVRDGITQSLHAASSPEEHAFLHRRKHLMPTSATGCAFELISRVIHRWRESGNARAEISGM